jgi:hypothetical protein
MVSSYYIPIMRFCLFLGAILLAGEAFAHAPCGVDHVHVNNTYTIGPESGLPSPKSVGRRLDGTGLQPIRIHIEWLDFDMGDKTEEFKQIVRDAIRWFEKTLMVVPYPGKLYATVNDCQGYTVPAHLKPGGAGVDADYIMITTGSDDGASDYVAWAGACQLDGTTLAPRVGTAFYNSYHMLSESYESNLATIRHEMTHALGFSSGLFNYFVDENNEPLSYRMEVVGTA